jgi:hypothetical protein
MNAPTDTAEQKSAADERIATLEAQLAEAMEFINAQKANQGAPVAAMATPVQEKPRTVMNLRELRQYEGTLYVQHNDPQRQFSCHQALGEHRVDFDLGPAGRGDDVGILPKLALEIRGIQRAWKRGVITISKEEDMDEQIDLMMQTHGSYAEDVLASLQVQVTPSNNERDIVTQPCVRCGRWGRDQYGATTPVVEGGKSMMTYADYKGGRPPLCEAHVNEEHLWVGTLITNPQTGQQGWEFQSRIVGETRPGVPVQQGQQPHVGPITPQHMQQFYQ